MTVIRVAVEPPLNQGTTLPTTANAQRVGRIANSMSKKSRQSQEDADLLNWIRSLKIQPPDNPSKTVKVTVRKVK